MLFSAVSLPMLSSVPGHVVVDRHRHADDRDVEGGVLLPVPVQFVRGLVAGPAAGHQQAVDPVRGNLFGDLRDGGAAGHVPVGADLGAAVGHPAADVHPAHFLDVARRAGRGIRS